MNVVTPDSVKHAIFYQIFSDRFARDTDHTNTRRARHAAQR